MRTKRPRILTIRVEDDMVRWLHRQAQQRRVAVAVVVRGLILDEMIAEHREKRRSADSGT